jgi:beta-glucosidase
MCSYNKINGEYASESKRFLTDILRDEWGFDGIVISDWGAVNDRVKGLIAGLELEMPSSGGFSDAKLVKAVKEGELEEAVLDQAATRILELVYRYKKNKKDDIIFDREKHHTLARKAAEESAVLLKNEAILPLKKETKLAFIGSFAKKPRYQGGGSSHINSFKTVGALEAVRSITEVLYAKGYETKEDLLKEELIHEACEAAKQAEVAIIFAGLPDSFESEGFDRKHMSMPECQNKLIEAVSAVQPNTVVVLHNGSPVEMPWADKVKGILEVYLGGQAVGEATVNLLYGYANPCGKLAETFPLKLEDNPSYLYYLGEKDIVEYREGVFVGYRYYDKKKAEVLFPFGYGLSYTTFKYSDLKLSRDSIKDTDTLTVSVKITNTGSTAGKEIVQLYVAPKGGTVIRPLKELKGFDKVSLEPGETKEVTFVLNKRAFAYYNTAINDWYAETGSYEILIGKSSRDIMVSAEVLLEATVMLPQKYHLNSTLGDILANPKAKELAKNIIDKYTGLNSDIDTDVMGESTSDMMAAMFLDTPLRAALLFGTGVIEEEEVLELINRLNQLEE